jgi:hypothetical protein
LYVSNQFIPLFVQADEERFEDDPAEFIVRDIEGEDSESRRRNSQDLLRAMCRQFEQETTRICMGHITAMLAEYAANPAGKWIAKDVAVRYLYRMCTWLLDCNSCFSLLLLSLLLYRSIYFSAYRFEPKVFPWESHNSMTTSM